MKENNHNSQVDLFNFQHDHMNPQEKIKFLEHISTCDFCNEQFTNCMIGETLTAPPDMKENILKAVKRPEVQIVHKVNETSKRMQLLWYSLKVGTATLGALALLLLAMNFNSSLSNATNNPIDIPAETSASDDNAFSLTATIRDKMDNFSNSILDFSNTIIKTEVIDYDQKEK